MSYYTSYNSNNIVLQSFLKNLVRKLGICLFFRTKEKYVRTYPDMPMQTKFWKKVFHNGFERDYYDKCLDGQSRECLDLIYTVLTEPDYQNAFISVFKVISV